jgi:hypothetical protein
MTDYAQLNLLNDREIAAKTHSEARTKIIRRLMIAALVSIVALAVIAEAHGVTSADWRSTFVNCCSRV